MFIKEPGTSLEKLALFGGSPVHEEEWPAWPRAGMSAQRALLDVLHSDRWTLSARARRTQIKEKQFAEDFSNYIGRAYGISCSSGTAALKIALQSMGVETGDEIIVPCLTWVAVGAVVAHLGCIPVFADIDNDSLCMSADSVKRLITSKTKAIIVAHMYSSRANMEVFKKLSKEKNLFLIEDASQAHGAVIGDEKVGAFGDISIFSMQQTKLLTGGEGGVALTDSEYHYHKMLQLRADGRVYGTVDSAGFLKLEDKNQILGSNLCLSEFHAAILIEGLQRLDLENEHRRANVAYLKEKIENLEGINIIEDNLQKDCGRTYYKVPLMFDDRYFNNIRPQFLAEILSKELFLPVETLDIPLHCKDALCKLISKLTNSSSETTKTTPEYPFADKAFQNTVTIPHYSMLGVEKDVDSIIRALVKISNARQSINELMEQAQ